MLTKATISASQYICFAFLLVNTSRQ